MLRLLPLAAVLVAACAPLAPAVTGLAGPAPRQQDIFIPMPGTAAGLFTRICRPAQPGPHRVAIINHGSAFGGAARSQMEPQRCDSEAAAWFLARGFMVVFPMRRGFGLTGGPMVESSGSCETPDYVASGLAGAEDIATVVAFTTALPDALPDDAVVIGQSLGGWAVVAYDSMPHPRVDALISMAGGRGGWAGGHPGVNCRADLLAHAAARFGAGSSTPMLWVYAANDSFFPPPVAEAMAAAYSGAGGKVTFVEVPPFDSEGHFLLYGRNGSQIWGPLVERYLEDRRPGS